MLDAAAERYVKEVAARLRGALGDDLLAVYLVGSAASGDWIAEVSDIDVLAVCARPLGEDAARLVVDSLSSRALPCPARGLELVVYHRDAVRAPVPPVRLELNLNTGRGMAERAARDAGGEPHWFVADLALARVFARPLVGPPAGELIGPVPRGVVLAALEQSLDWHREHEGASANTVLNACRAWRYAVEDRWSSKSQAAAWACARGGDAELIAQALALRAQPGGEPSAAGVHRHVAHVTSTVRAARAGRSRGR